MNQIFQHSSESMPELADGSVALTVTSPPYWNAIDYDIHARDKRRQCRTRAYAAGYAGYPGYLDWLEKIFGYYPNLMTEYILVFRKPGPPIYRDWNPAQKAGAAYPINRLFTLDTANNLWHIAPVPPGLIDHPCPYPEEIPHRLISLYSYPGELVLDPFAGSGQTLKVAHHLRRAYAGYEIVARYAALARRRITQPLSLRRRQLVAVFDKVGLDDPAGGAGRANGSVPAANRARRRNPPGL